MSKVGCGGSQLPLLSAGCTLTVKKYCAAILFQHFTITVISYHTVCQLVCTLNLWTTQCRCIDILNGNETLEFTLVSVCETLWTFELWMVWQTVRHNYPGVVILVMSSFLATASIWLWRFVTDRLGPFLNIRAKAILTAGFRQGTNQGLHALLYLKLCFMIIT